MRILKSYGTDGGIIVSASPFPEAFDTKEPVFIVFDGIPVPFFIEEIKPHGSTKFFIKLEDIESLSEAEELVGRDLSFGDGNGDKDDYLSGYTLISAETGMEVGEITGFVDIPGNPCIDVHGSLFPCHEDLIRKIDRKRKIVELYIPSGLLS